ncbi:MAG: hypothetical protein CM1200mP10_33010 [Candidatus Neomarinimicrobiota bacterium]|nr:MAG: hypothetical protein CM1200mP10_33010 [Candidatus Neomarinimicrobiota bacterium]
MAKTHTNRRRHIGILTTFKKHPERKNSPGKQLSYNNIMDADAALACIKEFDQTACVVVKHANPCGVAIGEELIDVYTRAFNAEVFLLSVVLLL